MSALLDRWPLWQRATTRERGLLAIGTLVVVVGVVWTLVWQPVTRELVQADADAARERAALSVARQQAAEIVAIAPASARGVVDVRAAVERALAQRALAASVSVADGRVRVIIAAARFAALVAALGALAQESGIRAVEATLSSRVEPGTVRAELTLVR